MEEVKRFFGDFFGTGNWPPRWYCGRWSEFHGWLYILSDLAIWAAYFTIPFLLIHFIRRKKDVPFPKIFWLFGAFIFACGTTHLIDAIIFWVPIYHVSAFVRFLTAIASWATIYALYKILPDAFSLKTPAELERVVNERTSELHQSINKMKFLADAMPQIVWTATPDGSIDYFNEPTLKFTGRPLSSLTERQWTTIIHPDDVEATLIKWEHSINNGTELEVECRFLGADGEYYWHLTRAIPHKDENSNVLLWVGTGTEIQTQKKAKELLEQKVLERTAELNIANVELQQSNSDLEQFAAIASHDLKAPLRTIRMYLSVLLERNSFDEKTAPYLTKSMTASDRMQQLIENLLTLSSINLGGQELEVVDLNNVIEKVLEDIEDLLASNVKVDVQALPKVYANEVQMSQLFQNLISNGIHYNSSEYPTVSVSCEDRVNHFQFEIKDNGVGIDPENLIKIFERFTRLQSERKGSGLGLSISKRIVEKLGGQIWVESTVGVGTAFYFTIPKVKVD